LTKPFLFPKHIATLLIGATVARKSRMAEGHIQHGSAGARGRTLRDDGLRPIVAD